jgi:hypothetical protein
LDTGVGEVSASAMSSLKLASMLSAVSLSTSVNRSLRKESSLIGPSRGAASVSVSSWLNSPSKVLSKEKLRVGTLLARSGVYP